MDATPAEVPMGSRTVGSQGSGPRLYAVVAPVGGSSRPTRARRLLATAPWCAAAAVAGIVGGADTWWRVSGALVGVLLGAAAVVDVREHRLPNRLVGGAFVVALGGAAASGDAAVVAASAGALLAGGLLLVVYLLRGVGMGDVKAAGAIGMALGPAGWWAAPSAIASAAVVASVYGAARGVRRLPFGPSLVLGWATVTLATGWW